MNKMVTLTIDRQTVTVSAGTIVVDAAKQVGITIPVFCYHPKLKPAGMCRVCLVEIGRPVIDRGTGKTLLNIDGTTQIQFGPKLETACTTPALEGMVVITDSQQVQNARRDVLEFLLTSHPLDCPICDKGGECPLQNLTMGFGPSRSRFEFDEKMHLAKHKPLGELIILDRERCIQCGRCVRFQSEIVDDPVIGFYNRGREIEIATFSEPGFDSIFSGNTTDICPVGALTTADFRFGARPWEMKAVASICNHCAVNCNITYNVRREARSNGRTIIKRVMPRQNEAVNELWICDKGRLDYHYAESSDRPMQPMIRVNGEQVVATWEDALDMAAQRLKEAKNQMVTMVGGRVSNEDLFNLQMLTQHLSGKAVLDSYMAGGDLVAQVGVGEGTNFKEMGKGTAIMVVACDLHEEAPLWWLRIKQAVERGATLIVVNPRKTRLDKYAAHILRYEYGSEIPSLLNFLIKQDAGSPAELFAQAENAVILFGSDGIGLAVSRAVAQTCAEILVKTGHVGKPNNGLIGVWPCGNTQGACDMGFRPYENLGELLIQSKVAYFTACDPAGDDPSLAHCINDAEFVIVQDMFMSETAKMADIFLPAAASMEREGSYTSGERRIQRFYPAVTPYPGPRADFAITAQISKRLGLALEGRSAGLIMQQIAASVPGYTGLDYQKLAKTEEQDPPVGRNNVYYGGTAYDNKQGSGVQLKPAAQKNQDYILPVQPQTGAPALILSEGRIKAVPVTYLYHQSHMISHTKLLENRLAGAVAQLHPQTAEKFNLKQGDVWFARLNDIEITLGIEVKQDIPQGVALIPRSAGVPIFEPAIIEFRQPAA